MREFLVTESHDKKRVDAFLFDMIINVPSSVIFKAFRKRNIRVNGKRINVSYVLSSGDKVQVYIPDDYFNDDNNINLSFANDPQIIYEDEYILTVSKPQGMPVQRDKNNENRVLDLWLRDFLKSRDGSPYNEGFPSLCHRLDRNTGGLVLFAKDQATLAILNDKFRFHEIKKKYHCIVYGTPKNNYDELHNYLWKDRKKSLVYIYDKPVKGSEPIITRYRVLKKLGDFSLLEIELVTGKTHQIRAHLSHIGHPILGDGKYGINSVNRLYKLKWQALWAKEIAFEFSSPSKHLDYINNTVITLPEIKWEAELNRIIN